MEANDGGMSEAKFFVQGVDRERRKSTKDARLAELEKKRNKLTALADLKSLSQALNRSSFAYGHGLGKMVVVKPDGEKEEISHSLLQAKAVRVLDSIHSISNSQVTGGVCLIYMTDPLKHAIAFWAGQVAGTRLLTCTVTPAGSSAEAEPSRAAAVKEALETVSCSEFHGFLQSCMPSKVILTANAFEAAAVKTLGEYYKDCAKYLNDPGTSKEGMLHCRLKDVYDRRAQFAECLSELVEYKTEPLKGAIRSWCLSRMSVDLLAAYSIMRDVCVKGTAALDQAASGQPEGKSEDASLLRRASADGAATTAAPKAQSARGEVMVLTDTVARAQYCRTVLPKNVQVFEMDELENMHLDKFKVLRRWRSLHPIDGEDVRVFVTCKAI